MRSGTTRRTDKSNLGTSPIPYIMLIPQSNVSFNSEQISSLEIAGLLTALFDAADLQAPCAIIALVPLSSPSNYVTNSQIYMQRVMELTNTFMTYNNWIRLLLSSIFISSKVWEDNAIWNIDYHQIFPDWPVSDMYSPSLLPVRKELTPGRDRLEKWYLESIDYDLSVKPTEYTNACFQLQDVTKTNLYMHPTKPLTVYGMSRLSVHPLSHNHI